LASDLRAISQVGIDPGGGVSRLCFTRAEREAHSLAREWLEDLGMEVRADSVGNTFGMRRGRLPDAPAIMVGSHLDSVPHGGDFDGVVGVVGAIELVRLLDQAGVRTEHPITVAIFSGEEGARFGQGFLGSKAVTGMLTTEHSWSLKDNDGVALAQAMIDVGMDPARLNAARWEPGTAAAFLEMHIEQARVLESEGRFIGLVDMVSGSTRLRMEVKGRAEHSGGTPMEVRRDALATASEIVLAVEGLATDPRHRGTRATVGHLQVQPNTITTVPGRVVFTVDVRDVDTDRQRAAATEIIERAHWICERRGATLEVEVIGDTSPAVLPMWLRQVMSHTCQELGIDFRVMSSGAGHDSAVVSRAVPAGLVFIPCRQGLSHVPEEWASVADIARGTELLYHVVLRLDALLASWENGANGRS
jgi:allantoate deiminase